MKRTAPYFAFAAFGLAALAACGGQSQSENAADQLDNAAEQSDPAAAAVLENQADAMREQGLTDVNSAAQDTLNLAADAQTGNAPQTTKAPPAAGAKPHQAGDPVPPPKTGGQ